MAIAQYNIARLRAPLDDPSIDPFRLALGRMNDLAKASPGFEWVLEDGSGTATSFRR